MVKDILFSAGFIENKTFKECRFLKPPKGTYAVYFDSCHAYGADDCNLLKGHEYRIELYSDVPDPGAEKRIEDSLDSHRFSYFKEERYWLEDESLYQVIYEFDYIEKKRGE